MGRVSKELKELKERAEKAFPVDGKDYYVVRVPMGGTSPKDWVYSSKHRSGIDKSIVLRFLNLQGPKFPSEKCYYGGKWYLLLGTKPDKKWGPVCP